MLHICRHYPIDHVVMYDLRNIEKERNQAAHNLKSISRKELHAMNIGSVDEILRKLYAAAVMTGLLSKNNEPNEKKARDIFFLLMTK